jgi:hypothetical protein
MILDSKLPPVLHRYMDFPELLYCLENNLIILGNPLYWEDKNDTFMIGQYVETNNLNNLFVSCFTSCGDAYHFWKIYAQKQTGICVTYDTLKVLDAIKKDPQSSEFRFEKVHYETYVNLSKREARIEEYPFIKRKAFIAEDEYRLIFESKNQIPYRTLKTNEAILEIILSPSIRDIYLKEYLALIRSKVNLPSNKIRKSTILESNRWQNLMRY